MKTIIKKIVGKLAELVVAVCLPILADAILDVLEELAQKSETKIDDTVLKEIRKKLGIPDND